MGLLYLGLAYLFAAVPFGLVVTTLFGADDDVRGAGSGNIGATNVVRVYGWRLALPVLLLDVGKGFFPVVVAGRLWPELGALWVGLVAVIVFIGHCFPVYLEFRGGKGVATGAGALLALAPLPVLGAALVWGTSLALSGRSSVAALTSGLAVVGLVWGVQPDVLPVTLLLAGGVCYTHAANIRRIVRGEERQIVRPVRWERGRRDRSGAVDVLSQGPAGKDEAPSLWKEAVGDPLDDAPVTGAS